MKHRILYIISVLIPLLAASCEDLRFGNAFLEMPTKSDMDIEEVFSASETAEQVLVQAYKKLPDGIYILQNQLGGDLLESLTDLNNGTKGYGPIKTVYYPGQLNSLTEGKLQKYNFLDGGAWTAIRYAYIFLENVDNVPDMSASMKLRRKAEAKMIIATHYAEMFRHYGGLPWLERSMTQEDNIDVPRLTAAETVEKITGLIDEAAPDLPWKADAEDDGRMTKAYALGLKVRVLLFAASPLFNDDQPYMSGEAADARLVWFGGKDDTRWQDVIDAGEEFMKELESNGYYTLVDTGNPREDFRNAYFTRGNTEVLLSTRRINKWSATQGTIYTECNYGIAGTTLEYVDMFPMADGSDFSWDNADHAAHPFFDADGQPVRDPRLYETVLINGDDYQGRKAETWIGGRERTNSNREKVLCPTGFCMRKFRQDWTSVKGQFYSWPHLRLSEVYLSIAEALNEAGRTGEAYEYVKLVRDRVDMDNIPDGLSKEEFREAILRERALEFGYENVRFFDLIRWKREDIFKKQLHGLDITSTDKGVTLQYASFTVPQTRAWQGDNWDPKWYLSPFPIDEINKDYGLVQNPGW